MSQLADLASESLILCQLARAKLALSQALIFTPIDDRRQELLLADVELLDRIFK
jgi:hypothetical protein